MPFFYSHVVVAAAAAFEFELRDEGDSRSQTDNKVEYFMLSVAAMAAQRCVLRPTHSTRRGSGTL